MRLSASGFAALVREEGLRLEAYPDPASGGDPWSIGIGCTRHKDGSPVKPGDVLTNGEANDLAQWHIEQIEAALEPLITVPVTSGQWDAMVSLAFNIGQSAFAHSTLLKKLNAGDYAGAAQEFDRWIYAAGKVMPGLINRRQREREMFASELPAEAVSSPAGPPSTAEDSMPIPALVYAAASALLPFVEDLFRGHGGTTAIRNADIIQKAGPALVEIAKTVSGQQTMEQAVENVMNDPAQQQAFRRSVELDVDRLVGMIQRVTEIDDASRDKAAARAAKEAHDMAPRMADQQFWLVCAVGVIIGAIAVVDVIKDGSMSEGVMALVVAFATWAMQKRGTIVDYRFGSSSGSQAKNEIIAAARK